MSRPHHRCRLPGCREEAPWRRPVCELHWILVPSRHRAINGRARRSGDILRIRAAEFLLLAHLVYQFELDAAPPRPDGWAPRGPITELGVEVEELHALTVGASSGWDKGGWAWSAARRRQRERGLVAG